MPSFAIEAQAEANPLSTQTLYQTLCSASSGDPQQVQVGTQQLQNWEKTPGFFSSLQSLYIDLSLPVEVRYLAILQLKNAIDKFWRDGSTATISVDEKALIRSRSLDAVFNEPDGRLALQSALFLAKVVRSEYPRKWLDAIPAIVGSLNEAWKQSPASSRTSRSLLVLLHVVKELSTARIRLSQKVLYDAAPLISNTLYEVYKDRSRVWLQFLRFGGDDEGGALTSMDISLLALRTLRRLWLSGYEHLNRDPSFAPIWEELRQQFGLMLNLISKDSPLELQNDPRQLVEKHLLQISKFYLRMAVDRAASFVLLPNALDLVRSYWQYARAYSHSYGTQTRTTREIGTNGDVDDDEDVSFEEELSLKALLILRACARMVFQPSQTFKYPTEEDKVEKAVAKNAIKEHLLTPEFVKDVMTIIITRFFVFTPRDLRQWEEEPDEWERDQEDAGDDWEFSIRTCSEKIFLDLIIHNKQVLVPPLIEIIQSAGAQSTDNVFLKDSIYAAIGLSAPVLEEMLDFASLLEKTFAPEVTVQAPRYNILRRRIAIVLSQWIPVKEGLNRNLVYEIFQHLLNKDDLLNDEVVRVTAGRKLLQIIEPYDFDASVFAPYADKILERLMLLIKETNLAETKLALLQTLSAIVTNLETLIDSHGDDILKMLDPLWAEAGDEYLLKQVILDILKALVTAMEKESQRYHKLIVPLIRSSIQQDSEDSLYLQEDAIGLWAAVLEQTSDEASPEVISLVECIVPMYDVASDTLQTALEITETYIYLIPQLILQNVTHFITPLYPLLDATTVKLEHRTVGQTCSLLTILIKTSFHLGGLEGTKSLTSSFSSSGILSILMSGLHSAYEAHQTSGPNKKPSTIDTVIEGEYLGVLARLAVVDAALFLQILQILQPAPVIDWLLTEWLSEIDNITNPISKKLSTMALTNIFSTGQTFILSRLQLLMSIWTDVLNDLLEEDEVPPNSGTIVKRDCLIYTRESLISEDDSPATRRSKNLLLTDPVHTIDLRDYVREKIGMAVNTVGGMQAFNQQWVDGVVDTDVLKGFGELGLF